LIPTEEELFDRLTMMLAKIGNNYVSEDFCRHYYDVWFDYLRRKAYREPASKRFDAPELKTRGIGT